MMSRSMTAPPSPRTPPPTARARPSLLVVLTAMLAAGCGRTPTSVVDLAPGRYRGDAWIMATPNPVPAGWGPGATTISWDTGTGKPGQVYVSEDGKPEVFFSNNDSYHQYVQTIGWGSYEYRLYAEEDRTTPL